MCLSWMLAAAPFLPLILSAAASEPFCVPAQAPLLPPPPAPSALGGPPLAHAALRPHLRRCLYLHLPPPQSTTLLELCLHKSARMIDKENFSVFLGYFSRWEETGAANYAAVQEYAGGNSWSCKGGVERSVTLRIRCSGSSGAEGPAISQWTDNGACHYEALLMLPGSC
jgi:hypothetical protein